MSMIQNMITRFLSMHLKKLIQNVSPNVELNLMTKKHNKTPWITNGILRSITSRNKLYKKRKKTKTDSPSYITKKTNFNRYIH